MKFVVISAVRPFPPRSGSELRVWHNIQMLKAFGSVSVFSFGDRVANVESIPGVDYWIHIDDNDYPERAFSGLARFLKLIRTRQFPIQNDYVTEELNQRLREFLELTNPDVIILANWADALPDALRYAPQLIIDTHNVESKLKADLLRGTQGRLGLSQRMQILRFERRERKLLRAGSNVWACSSDDRTALKALDQRMPDAVVIPNVMDVDAYASVRKRAFDRPNELAIKAPTIIYVAKYSYAPNRDAAHELVDRIFPVIATRVPNARIVFVGQDPTEHLISAARNNHNIIVTGCVDDPRPYLSAADVCAVPLRTGSGTRLKIIEAFAAYIPVVSTSKGVEGIAAESGRHLTVADDPRQFAEAVIDVLEHPERHSSRCDAALQLAYENYSIQTLRRLLPEALPPSIIANLEISRSCKPSGETASVTRAKDDPAH